MTSFTEKVVQIISSIPRGKVMTYGQIAGLSEHPRAARQVVRILHSMSRKYDLPWYRVLNSKGQIGFKDEEGFKEQKRFLELEGIEVGINGRIDLDIYQWHPDRV
ncbi:methylated-DNA-(protein)-cysteine S-methyltransferase [Clostridium aceticum]|uniref:Methylated-DNA-(Protein)-cysteine S-methyltransferase n=1 Tax=Clostridium aceticum TaxID=84022 RepID=A0A0D8ICI2_9CLOT|nr:MGMT family protein [Clostridium aceticum]AKL95138.1 methylated-DNA-(protein)-cysteine S-methyltransferase [Clostridium aceticum]KJF28015.1 hypothetical protein TZ02_05490 [Clostridium aceticum]